MNRLLMTLALCLMLCAPSWAGDDDACRDEMGQLARMSPAILGSGSVVAAACVESTPDTDHCEVGHITTETNNASISTYYMYCGLFAADSSGTPGEGYVKTYRATTNGYAKVSLYSTTDTDESAAPTNGSRIAYTSAITVTADTHGWWHGTTTTSSTVTKDSKYWVCFQPGQSSMYQYHAHTGGTTHIIATQANDYNSTPPSTIPLTASCTAANDPWDCCTGSGAGCAITTTTNHVLSLFVGIK